MDVNFEDLALAQSVVVASPPSLANALRPKNISIGSECFSDGGRDVNFFQLSERLSGWRGRSHFFCPFSRQDDRQFICRFVPSLFDPMSNY